MITRISERRRRRPSVRADLARPRRLDRPWALELLAEAANMCLAPLDPFRSTHAHLAWGGALEASGDLAGALRAYRVVIDRWAKATPRSMSAETAAARLEALSRGTG